MRVAGLPHPGVHLPRQRPGGGVPDFPTETAADRLIRNGDQAIQVSTPALDGPGAFYRIAQLRPHGQPGAADRPDGIQRRRGAGDAAGRPARPERPAVMDYYGPPDLDAWLASHGR